MRIQLILAIATFILASLDMAPINTHTRVVLLSMTLKVRDTTKSATALGASWTAAVGSSWQRDIAHSMSRRGCHPQRKAKVLGRYPRDGDYLAIAGHGSQVIDRREVVGWVISASDLGNAASSKAWN